MIREVVIVTDSASYLPEHVRTRYGVAVVPLTVTIGGQSYREGLDIDPDTFYLLLGDGVQVTTSQPSPGDLLQAYEQAASAGAKAVVSAHIGSTMSGTVQSAKLAAGMAPLPVHVVDTHQASFAEGLVVWELIEALERGAEPSSAQKIADDAASRGGSTFLLRGLDLIKRGGRLAWDAETAADAIPILALAEGAVKVVGQAATIDEAVALMASHVRAAAERARGSLRVGVGHGAADEIACALHREIEQLDNISEVIDYVVGPSIGAHTGAGNAGAVFIDRPIR